MDQRGTYGGWKQDRTMIAGADCSRTFRASGSNSYSDTLALRIGRLPAQLRGPSAESETESETE